MTVRSPEWLLCSSPSLVRRLGFAYGLLYIDGVTVVALPKESTDFALAGARERRHCDDRRGRFGKNRQHPNFFLKRIGTRFTRRARSGNLHFPHRVGRIEHTLSAGVTKQAAEKVLDVAERRAAQIFLTSNRRQRLLALEGPERI
jgi:hypothetical protein